MQSTVFIDFDGTICFNRFWEHLPDNEYSLIQTTLFRPGSKLVNEWMRGLYSYEDICGIVSRDTKLNKHYLINELERSCAEFTVSREILDAIQLLRTQCYVTLITGNMDTFHRITVLSLQLHRYFDEIITSWEVGLLKTDDNGKIFKLYCDSPLNDSYLIEDSSSSCEVFAQLGGTAFQVTHDTSVVDHIENQFLQKVSRGTK